MVYKPTNYPNGITTTALTINATNVPITSGSILDLASTTSAFMPPRMTTAQRNAITGVAGMMVYDATLNKLVVYTGAGWEVVTSV